MQDLALVYLLRAQHVKKQQELNLNYLIYLTRDNYENYNLKILTLHYSSLT